jgi:hypothetical protein
MLHVLRSHDVEGVSVEQVAMRCRKIELNKSDVRLVMEGKPPSLPVPHITCRSAGHGYNDSEETAEEDIEGRAAGSGARKLQHVMPGADWESLSHTYPHVRKVDGKWVELSCKYCGVNGGLQKGFFAGLHGLRMHAIGAHGKKVYYNALEHCHQRQLSEDQIRQLRSNPACKPVDAGISKRFVPTEEDTALGMGQTYARREMSRLSNNADEISPFTGQRTSEADHQSPSIRNASLSRFSIGPYHVIDMDSDSEGQSSKDGD